MAIWFPTVDIVRYFVGKDGIELSPAWGAEIFKLIHKEIGWFYAHIQRHCRTAETY